MELRDLIKKILFSYPAIYGCSMMATFVFCMVFYHEDAVFGMDYFGLMLLFSLAGDLPILVFYSKREMSQKEMNVRLLIHFLLLECVLMVLGRFFGLYKSFLQGVFFFFIVLVVYVIIRASVFCEDIRRAKQLNDALAERKRMEEQQEC